MEDEEFLVMAVGGPNARNDFHYNEGEEFFFQIKGDVSVFVQENGQKREVKLREGEMFLLPARMPHQPVRPADTVGLVIERKRKDSEKDGLIWYCSACNNKLFEKYFQLQSIEKDFIPVFKEFNLNEALRTCANCGHVEPADQRYL